MHVYPCKWEQRVNVTCKGGYVRGQRSPGSMHMAWTQSKRDDTEGWGPWFQRQHGLARPWSSARALRAPVSRPCLSQTGPVAPLSAFPCPPQINALAPAIQTRRKCNKVTALSCHFLKLMECCTVFPGT